MAPRKETVQERTTLVAILLADTFDTVHFDDQCPLSHSVFQSLGPVSVECAPVLLPLIQVPLIEYSLEWLAANDVDEVRKSVTRRKQ